MYNTDLMHLNVELFDMVVFSILINKHVMIQLFLWRAKNTTRKIIEEPQASYSVNMVRG
jgi:hypothetical protein